MVADYVLTSMPYILSDSMFDNPVVMDGLGQQYVAWDALARSGEYFSHLANMIDEISLNMSMCNPKESERLDSIVEQLLYMQAVYAVIRRD